MLCLLTLPFRLMFAVLFLPFLLLKAVVKLVLGLILLPIVLVLAGAGLVIGVLAVSFAILLPILPFVVLGLLVLGFAKLVSHPAAI